MGNRPTPYLTAARDIEQQRRDAETVDKLVDTLPKDQGEVTQSQVYMGLGYKKQNTRDLQAQLAVARMTGNRDLQQPIKRELDKERPLASEGVLGTEGGKTAAEFISRSKVTDSRAAEVEGDKYAAEQRSTMLGMARLLQSKKIMLPGKREQLLSDAKETYIAQHAAEIEALTKGSRPVPYRQTIRHTIGGNGKRGVLGRCTCPIGWNCKHVAAVLAALAQE
jgi:hypothetical protein